MGLVHRPPFAHELVTPVMVEEVVGRVLVPVVNCVEVIVVFQPRSALAPVRVSLRISGVVKVCAWSPLLRLAEKLGAALVETESVACEASRRAIVAASQTPLDTDGVTVFALVAPALAWVKSASSDVFEPEETSKRSVVEASGVTVATAPKEATART